MPLRQGAHHELGRHGEQLAADFLVANGYGLLARNLELKVGEIDLLMADGDTIVVVEVKTQARDTFLDPVYKIGPAKQRKLHLLASIIASRYPDRNVRIDAVTVTNTPVPVITHLENVI
jgi:putative endonuclease